MEGKGTLATRDLRGHLPISLNQSPETAQGVLEATMIIPTRVATWYNSQTGANTEKYNYQLVLRGRCAITGLTGIV